MTESDIASRFPTLKLDPDASGYQDNDDDAESTLDPEDTASDLAGQGRLDGYQVEFPDPGGLFLIQVSVDFFDTPESAQASFELQIADFCRFEGDEVEEGVVLEEFLTSDAPDIGEDATAGRLVVNFKSAGLTATFTFVSWVSGTLVANTAVVAFDDVDRSTAINLLARRMNLKVEGALAGVVGVTPIAPTPTPVLGPEEAARQEGFDLPAMLPATEDVSEEATVASEWFVAEPDTVSSYKREFSPSGLLMAMGSSQVLNVSTSVDLSGRALDASGPVSELKGMTPVEFAELAGPALAQQAGLSLEELDFESLALPVIGDVAAGFLMKVQTEDIDFEGYLVFFAGAGSRPTCLSWALLTSSVSKTSFHWPG